MREHDTPLLGVVGGRRGDRSPARSYSTPRCTTSVASPPSSRIMFGPPPSGQRSACSVHHQYSSSVSPFHAYTGMPRAAIAAAAWSWVEKMLQDAQRTWAPSAMSVSMSTAVWIGHVQRPGDAGAGERLGGAVPLAQRHEAGHLVLGELDLLAPEVGEREVGDLEVGGRQWTWSWSVGWGLLSSVRAAREAGAQCVRRPVDDWGVGPDHRVTAADGPTRRSV